MKALWKVAAGRIDALSLRERALIFWTLLICGLVLEDQLLLEPAQRAHALMVASVKQQGTELQLLRDQLVQRKVEPAPAGAPRSLRADIAEVQARLDDVDRRIVQLTKPMGEVDPLPGVLLHILRRHEGLTLERTATLPPEAGPTPLQAGAEAAPAGLLRHGMTFTVTGPYAELMRYVQTLEQELPALRWGTMRLNRGEPAPTLTLQVFWIERGS